MPALTRTLPLALALSIIIPFALPNSADAAVRSLTLIRAVATLPGETAQIGRFEEDQQIDLLFEFDLDSDSEETARLTWDVYDRHSHVAFSSEREEECAPGRNTIRIAGAVPNDLGTGLQTYMVYASVRVGDLKEDTELELRVQSPHAIPGVIIEDVRLRPREDESIVAQELAGAAIPYTLEIDYRVENIISWARAQIRWLGLTVDGFVLDRGIGTSTVEEGFNTFEVDGYLARPPRGSTPQADFSVEIVVFGYFDSVTFPIDTLPVSLVEIKATRGVEAGGRAFSVGEAYLLTGEGVRASFFGKDEAIVARLLTGGVIPENTALLMRLSGGPAESVEDFMMRPEPGTESPNLDFDLPADAEREPGFYEFTWSVVIGDVLFAERRTSLTISGRQGFSIPAVVDLPGPAQFTAPLSWTVTLESEPGLFATMLTPDGIVCRLMGNTIDEPLNVGLLADLFESRPQVSGVSEDAVLLTTEESELEGTWESVRRAYLGDGRVFVHDYWLYRIGDGEYQFLVATSVGNQDQIAEAYTASDSIRAGLDLTP